jgi:hypothetical protein
VKKYCSQSGRGAEVLEKNCPLHMFSTCTTVSTCNNLYNYVCVHSVPSSHLFFLFKALLPCPARFLPLLFLVPNSLFLFFPFFGRPPVNLSRIFLSSSEPPPTARALAMRNHRIANAFEAAFNFNRFLAHATDPSSSESSSAFEKRNEKSQSQFLHNNNHHQQQPPPTTTGTPPKRTTNDSSQRSPTTTFSHNVRRLMFPFQNNRSRGCC